MKKKNSKKSLSKKSKDSKDKGNLSKKSSISKSSSKSKSKSKSKEKDAKKTASKKDLEIVTDANKINQPQLNTNMPQTTIDLNTNIEETPLQGRNINNPPNFNYRTSPLMSNGYISPTSAGNNIIFGNQSMDNFNLRTQQNFNAEEIKCEGCSELNAICYCTECKKSFCAQCENQIHTIPAMKNHIRRPVKDLVFLKKLCLHHNQSLTYFCASCDEAICKECQQLGPHNTKYHSIISIKEAFNLKHMKLSKLINDTLYYRYNKLNINIKIIEKILEKIISDSNEAERDINKYFNNLLYNLKNAKGKRLAMLDFETGFIQKNIIALEELKDYVFDTKENNDDLLDFVMKFESVKNKMEELLAKPKKLNISDDILQLPYEINYEKEKMNIYTQMLTELKSKNNEIFDLLNDTKVYIDNQIMKNEGNLVVLNTNNNNLNQNLEKSNNRYSILKRPSNASGNKYNAMSYDFNLKNDLNNNNLDLLKDIQELMEHGDLNLYQILSDYKSKEKMDCINIQDIPIALKIASIDTNVDEVNNLLDILLMPKKNLVNIKDFLINVLLYKTN
jgi:hypothetical protein